MRARSVDPLADLRSAAAFELLRHATRTRLPEFASVAELARGLMVEDGELRWFLAGQRPERLLWDALTLFARERPVTTDLGMIGFALVVDRLPLRLRLDARRDLADRLVGFLDERGEPQPEWLMDEVTLPRSPR